MPLISLSFFDVNGAEYLNQSKSSSFTCKQYCRNIKWAIGARAREHPLDICDAEHNVKCNLDYKMFKFKLLSKLVYFPKDKLYLL